jgi:Short C-terminal domain
MAEPTSPAAPRAGRGRLVLARSLVVVGIVLAVVSALANYVRYQALDESDFKETSRLLISNDEIQTQVAAALVDALYQNIDVAGELEQQLPENLQGLAGPIAGLSREVADRAAKELLQRPAVQTLWVEATAVSHARLVALLEGDTRFVDTANGDVVLDLQPLVTRLADRFTFLAGAVQQLPTNAARITILESGELETAQDLTHVLEIVAAWIWVFALAAWAAAVWLARGRRRIELRAIAIGLVVAGFLLVAIRALAGDYVVDSLVQSESVKPAASDAWDIVTRLLAGSGWAFVIVGVVALFGIWLAGPGQRARAVLEALAPSLRRPEVAYGTAAVLYLLLLLWQPTPQFGRWLWVLLFAVLGAVGVEALRRQAANEFPDAGDETFVHVLSTKIGGRPSAIRRSDAPTDSSPATAELERLADLHARGALSDDEFAAAKRSLLGPDTPPST